MLVINGLHIGVKRVAGTTPESRPGRAAVPSAGDKFGKWTFLGQANKYRWALRCECGTERQVRAGDVRNGHSKSCGCSSNKKANSGDKLRKHGVTFDDKVYRAWQSIKQRVFNPNVRNYHRYGGRGISMYPLWAEDFEAFRAAVGSPPSPSHSLDRIDNDGNYEPGNVRWATASEQRTNQGDAILVTISGHAEARPLAELCRERGVKYATAWRRLQVGLSPDQALNPSTRYDRSKGMYVSH